MYFQNVLAIHENSSPDVSGENAADVAAENFVEICVEDASLEGHFDQKGNKI